jgi:Zn-dependent protease
MNFQQPIHHHKGNLWHFSEEEKRHLMLATGAFALALGLMMSGGLSGLFAVGFSKWVLQLLLFMPIMLLAVGPAFLLHEIGHKIAARHYGCWAEFRADPKGLRFGLLLAAFLGIVFMAPGAVMVAGLVTRKQNGHIAIAGPLVNLGLFLIGIPLWALILGLTGVDMPTEVLVGNKVSWHGMVWMAAQFWLSANLVLGAFNMLPFGPLDGVKVKAWSEQAYFVLLSIFLIPIITWWFMGLWSPMDLVVSIASIF